MPETNVTPGEPAVVVPALPALPSDGGPVGGLLAGKFANAEELAKGYSNLAALLGKQGKVDDTQLAALIAKLPDPVAAAPAAPAPVVPAAPAAAAPVSPLQIPAATAAAEAAGLSMEAMTAEYQKDGKLSDTSMAKLATVGITKEAVDTFILGQEAIVEQVERRAHAEVGGEAKFKQMVTWAQTGMSPEEIVAFNAAVIGTPAAQKLALVGLKARFEAAVGSAPGLVRGDAAGSGAGGYESRAQVTADMKDLRYKKDPAYREAVKQKLSRSGPLA